MARKEVLFNEEDYTRKHYLETLNQNQQQEIGLIIFLQLKLSGKNKHG